MKADIYFLEFLKPDLSGVGGGGIGTLIMHLIPVLIDCGNEVTIYQCSHRSFTEEYSGATVTGIPIFPGNKVPNEKVVSEFRKFAKQQSGASERIEIFAADFFSVWNRNPLSIAVQNGLAWDASLNLLGNGSSRISRMKERVIRWRNQERGLRRFERCFNRVAVDLYFINWYRSFRGPDYPGRIFYNPNPSPPSHWDKRREQITTDSPTRIIMARRLVPEKGTRLAEIVFSRLLKQYKDIEITIAGEGRDLEFLKRTFSVDRRVNFMVFSPDQAAKVHQNYEIAVIPSLCGEATCLAVFEAMSAGCAVVASNMGGTITQIIDGYNGLLCEPDEHSFYQALSYLIENPFKRISLAKRGWEISQKVFSLEQWKNRWKSIIIDIVEGRDEAMRIIDNEWHPALLDKWLHHKNRIPY